MEQTSEQRRLEKNQRIKASGIATRARHAQMKCTTREVKIATGKLKAAQAEALRRMFLEAKWLSNDCIAWMDDAEEGEKRYPSNYKATHDLRHVHVMMPDKTLDSRVIERLPKQVSQYVVDQISQDIKNLAKKKARGGKVGRLKYKKEVSSIPLMQYGKTFSIKSKTKVHIAGVPKDVRVLGLDQIPEGADVSCAKLVSKAHGYYLDITYYTTKPKNPSPCYDRVVGLDFGLKTTITTSDGDKHRCLAEEPKRLRRLQRKAAKQVKGSRNYVKTRRQIRKCYERLSNKKDEFANQLVHGLTESYDVVCMQDESLKAWHRTYGKTVQHSCLGRVKAKLVSNPKVIVLDRFVATTKTCPVCGEKHAIPLSERTFACPSSDYSLDRDVHAARNMIVLSLDKDNIKLGQELAELTLAERSSAAWDIVQDALGKNPSLRQETTQSSAAR